MAGGGDAITGGPESESGNQSPEEEAYDRIFVFGSHVSIIPELDKT